MQKSRTIFIGDIHGCYDEFMLLLEKLKITEDDKIYLTGDLLNDNLENDTKLLKFLYNNQNQFKSIMGNAELGLKLIHENNLKKDYIHYKLINNAYNYYKQNHTQLLNYIINLPGIIETKDFILIHASLGHNNNGNTNNISLEILTDIYWRDDDNFQLGWYKTYSGNKKVIYGHFGGDGITIFKNTIGIDGWCRAGGFLSAYILETGEIVQQRALKLYEKPYLWKQKLL